MSNIGKVVQIDHSWGLGKIQLEGSCEQFFFDTSCSIFMKLKNGDAVIFDSNIFDGWYKATNIVQVEFESLVGV